MQNRKCFFIPGALGIEAASFASESGTGFGDGNEDRDVFFERDGNMASKDIAESPAAQPNAQEKTKVKRLRTKDFFLIFANLNFKFRNR